MLDPGRAHAQPAVVRLAVCRERNRLMIGAWEKQRPVVASRPPRAVFDADPPPDHSTHGYTQLPLPTGTGTNPLSPTPGAFLGGYSRGSAVSTYAAGSDSVVTTGSCPGPLFRLSAFLAPLNPPGLGVAPGHSPALRLLGATNLLGRVAEVRPTGDGRSFLIDQLRRIQQPFLVL